MTKTEFVDALRRPPHAVNFDGSRLSGPGAVVSGALADSLEATLPADEIVRFGVETSAFGNDWAGQLTWFLALRRQLLELTAEIEKDAATHEARALKVVQRTVSLVGEQSGVRIELRYRGRVQPSLAEARVILRDGSEVAGDRVSPGGLCRFFSSILAVASREGQSPE